MGVVGLEVKPGWREVVGDGAEGSTEVVLHV